MKRVPTAEVKKRSRELTSLFESFNPYSGMEGKVERVWVTDVASDGVHLVSTLCFTFTRLASPDDMHRRNVIVLYYQVIW